MSNQVQKPRDKRSKALKASPNQISKARQIRRILILPRTFVTQQKGMMGGCESVAQRGEQRQIKLAVSTGIIDSPG